MDMSTPTILIENNKMKLEMEMEGNSVILRPIGTLDEDVDFPRVVEKLKSLESEVRSVQFDLSQVTRMNSCGVREWVLLMDKIPPSLEKSFIRVGSIFAEQANMLPGIFGKKGTGKILSFELPYHCETCRMDVSFHAEPQTLPQKDGRPYPPSFPCEKCGKVLEFDSLDQEYFDFLSLI